MTRHEELTLKGMNCAREDYVSGRVQIDYYAENIMPYDDKRLDGLDDSEKSIVRSGYEFWFSLKKSGY